MEKERLKAQWLEEERCAHIRGWDFSHIRGRYSEEDDLPWNYGRVVRERLEPGHRLLDLDTGGGEFLLSLRHPAGSTAATEAYPPNMQLCRQTLLPLGIDFREADASGPLPFEDGRFDRVLDRHGDYNAAEIFRVLRPGGLFITEQVGAQNDRELVELLLPGTPVPFPELYLDHTGLEFSRAGFSIVLAQEAFRPIRFFDVGALVWFAHIIEWEFPGFSVESCLNRLYEAERMLEKDGFVEGRIHRFLLAAQKG